NDLEAETTPTGRSTHARVHNWCGQRQTATNGIHDMGVMHGMGPIEYEKDEPVFYHDWEARTYALSLALRLGGQFNLDAARNAIEQLPPADYLRLSYY